ncbi:FAD-binding oxidoreductase [Synechococcus sp. CS-602]|uniref:FAD-dependent oxidoreductase n=1 Tax=Synechococcaceae TaxID=1890426 RepID=UPI0008FF0EFD|nr:MULTISPECIES: FAD-dependent oxidoreductase [Synechococcaceae]MCT0205112.1 FAD-binding oxidoreductase [Synechococcus sp. CS-602]MCT0245786.1 FAD-binding oxidoreductase [Synechococcus sp. CS-601]TWB95176.1 glycine/D-amino acid oxidase-like deaminating enzyme [Synechococcus sp. Ace-Pa]
MASRRQFLLGSTALASSVLAGAWRPVTAAPALEGSLLPTDFTAAAPDLAPERIARRLVGLRPFRPMGVRIEVEAIGDTTLIHHYGHGGSGVTLSWGTARQAVDLVLAAPGRGAVAVLGGGAVGLATAWLLRERGRPVRVYAERFSPATTSDVAAARWFPSQLLDTEFRTPEIEANLVKALLFSHQRFRRLIGRGYGVDLIPHIRLGLRPPSPGWVDALLADLIPPPENVSDRDLPFQAPYVGAVPGMLIDMPIYMRAMKRDLRRMGVVFLQRRFEAPAQIAALPESVVVNCTGLGSATLFGANELVPIKGQLTMLPPDPHLRYTLSAGSLYLHPRSEGILLGGTYSHGDATTSFDTEAEKRILAGFAELYALPPGPRSATPAARGQA